MSAPEPYSPDRSLKGKLRRRWARVVHRRPLKSTIDRPLISFSFDDAPVSAATTGAEVLQTRGARGTFYVCAGLAGRPGHMGDYGLMSDYADLSVRGHEIACHTFSHLDCGKAGPSEINRDVNRNAEALDQAGLDTRHFAYPYGDVSPAAKRALQVRFASMRALHPGLVRKGSDLNQLPAVGIEGRDGERRAAAWIDRALAQRAWLILYTHDVRPEATDWGCTPQALDRLIQRAQDGGAQIATVGAALARLQGPI